MIIFVLTVPANAAQVHISVIRICRGKISLNCYNSTPVTLELSKVLETFAQSILLFDCFDYLNGSILYITEREIVFIDVILTIQTCTKKMNSQLIM